MKPTEEELKVFNEITSGLSDAVQKKEVDLETAAQGVKAYFKLGSHNPDRIWKKKQS